MRSLARQTAGTPPIDRASLEYAVSLEFDHDPVVTSRGRICAAKTTTVVVTALKKALLEHPHARWRSLVIVVERPTRLSTTAESRLNTAGQQRVA